MLKKYNENWEGSGLSDYKNEYEVVGLPSGQVIFMNKKQVNYFESRKYISWKANLKIGGQRVKLSSYIFDDENLEEIKEKIDLISW